MPRKNLLSLHEAIVIALINTPLRTASFEEIAAFITARNLYPVRKGNIDLATQVMLRSTKANGAYHHLFEMIDQNTIRIREHQSEQIKNLEQENAAVKEKFKEVNFQRGLDKVLLGFHENNFAAAAADLLINPNPVTVHGTEAGKGYDVKLSLQNILAIESRGRIKIIFLKEKTIPLEGGKPRLKIETNEGFESLLKRIQGSGHHIIRVRDKYAVNIYQYELTGKNTFTLIINLPKGLNEELKTIKTDKKFDTELYHTRLMEIDRLSKYHHDFAVNIQKIEEINRYKNR